MEELFHDSPTPRILLELARVREQLGKFEEANRLYKFALGIPDLPLIVRDNVTKRLNNIRGRQGFIDYSVALCLTTTL